MAKIFRRLHGVRRKKDTVFSSREQEGAVVLEKATSPAAVFSLSYCSSTSEYKDDTAARSIYYIVIQRWVSRRIERLMKF